MITRTKFAQVSLSGHRCLGTNSFEAPGAARTYHLVHLASIIRKETHVIVNVWRLCDPKLDDVAQFNNRLPSAQHQSQKVTSISWRHKMLEDEHEKNII